MKKNFVALLVGTSICFAHQVSVNVIDEYPPQSGQSYNSESYSVDLGIAGLHFHINNPENKNRTVRIAYQFLAQENDRFVIDRTIGCADKNIKGITDATINLSNTDGKGHYLLDVMLDMPQGTKDFCILMRRNDYGLFKANGSFKPSWEVSVDGEPLRYTNAKSPLDHKLTYNYTVKPHSVGHQLKPGEIFSAKTLYDDKTKGLSEAERFRHYVGYYTRNVVAKSLVDLYMKSYGAYKDTRMLIATAGPLADFYRWNESTFDGHSHFDTGTDEREKFLGRCWAIAVFNLYSFFYGNRNEKNDALTQDELVFMEKVTIWGGDPKYGVFQAGLEGEKNARNVKLFNKVMYGADAKMFDVKNNPLNAKAVYDFIKNGTPLYISMMTEDGGHELLIDGVAITVDGKSDTLVHLVNTDNFGSEMYVYWDALKRDEKNSGSIGITAYVTYKKPTGFEKTETRYPVDVDSDGDGIVDFDEHYRFGTDEKKYSSTDDGVSDYEKIYSETVGNKVVNIDNEYSFSDKIFDGEPVDIPKNITFYALNNLSVNDNVTCFYKYSEEEFMRESVKNEGCNIASEGEENRYAVRVGSRAFVNAIYSKGSVFIRDRARFGNVGIFTQKGNNHDVDFQGDSFGYLERVFYLNSVTWPFDVKKNVESVDYLIGSQQKIVRNGETFTISDEEGHNNFKLLKVEGGGKLVIGTGEIYVGNIQLESGSTFMFENPGYRTVLHLNGSVIWRGKYVENKAAADPREKMSIAVAQGFKLIQHSANEMDISSIWHGTIIAPYSKVVLGQASESKKIIGHVLAKDIVVHQNSVVYQQFFSPKRIRTSPKKRAGEIKKETVIASTVGPAVKIMNVSREEVGFTVSKPGLYNFVIMKMDGSVVSSFQANRGMPGTESVKWNTRNIPNGLYILSIRHEGKNYSKVFSLM